MFKFTNFLKMLCYDKKLCMKTHLKYTHNVLCMNKEIVSQIINSHKKETTSSLFGSNVKILRSCLEFFFML